MIARYRVPDTGMIPHGGQVDLSNLAPQPFPVPVSAHFCPYEQCLDIVIGHLAAATETIWVQAYTFTQDHLARALLQAHHRGVDVQVIACRSRHRDGFQRLPDLARAGVPCYWDGQHRIAHDKCCLIDHLWVLTGSINWSLAAQSSGETLLVLGPDRHLTARFEQNWVRHLAHSDPWHLSV